MRISFAHGSTLNWSGELAEFLTQSFWRNTLLIVTA